MEEKKLIIGLDCKTTKIKVLIEKHDVSSLIYFGKKVQILAEYENIFPGKVISTGAELQQASEELRRPFIELIGGLAKTFDSLAWWSSRIAEKNPMVSKLFLFCCQLKVVSSRLARQDAGSMCVIVQNEALKSCIVNEASKNGFRIVEIDNCTRRPWNRAKRSFIKIIFYILHYILRFSFRYICANLIKIKPDPKDSEQTPFIAIHTWADEKAFDNEGRFRDRYFSGLTDWMAEKGFSILVIPEIFTSGIKAFSETVKKIVYSAQGKRKFVIREHWLSLTDYFLPIIVYVRQLGWKFKGIRLLDADITLLLNDAKYDQGVEEVVLNYCLVRRLSKKGIKIGLFIDAFEYMIPERMFSIGFKEFYPQAKRVGYQHFALSPNMLCSFISQQELPYITLPDIIVTNGPFYKNILEQEGYAKEKLKDGPALRYEYLLKMRGTPLERKGKIGILIPLPLDYNSAFELAFKSVSALKRLNDIEIWIKPHPFMIENDLNKIVQACRAITSGFSIIKKEMKEILPVTDIGIVLASSSALDLVAYGIPAIRMGSEININIDPLGWQKGSEVFYTLMDVQARVEEIIKRYHEERARSISYAEIFRKEYFGPVNDTTMGNFIKPLSH